MSKAYELVRVGMYGRKLHALDPAEGRAFCETKTPSRNKHRVQDGAGGYSDHSRSKWSQIIPTGRHGRPSCTHCRHWTETA